MYLLQMTIKWVNGGRPDLMGTADGIPKVRAFVSDSHLHLEVMLQPCCVSS